MADDIERRVGEELKALRRHRGWSLRELARVSGLSVTTVHQIEAGRTSPGLGTLQSLATALGVSMGVLFDERRRPAPAVHMAARERPGVAIPGGRLEQLASGLANQRLRGFVMMLRPRRDTGPSAIVHPGQELVLGLEGACVYEVDGRRYALETGDSLLFESNQPHRVLNPGSRTARVLLLMYAPEEEPRWIEPHMISAIRLGKQRHRSQRRDGGKRGTR